MREEQECRKPSREVAAKLMDVVSYIEARGRAARFNMAMWFRRDMANPRCETSCCFAGFAAEKAGLMPDPTHPKWENDKNWFTSDGMDVSTWARARLGLTYDQAQRIFHETYWPSSFRSQSHSTADEKVALLRKRIEHFIETGD